jgi:hypothetical protein
MWGSKIKRKTDLDIYLEGLRVDTFSRYENKLISDNMPNFV